MSNELNYLLSRAAKGLMSRREFVGRAGALGVSAAMASSLLSSAALMLLGSTATSDSIQA